MTEPNISVVIQKKGRVPFSGYRVTAVLWVVDEFEPIMQVSTNARSKRRSVKVAEALGAGLSVLYHGVGASNESL